MKVEISPEACDEVVKSELTWWIEQLEHPECNYQADDKERRKIAKAMRIVLEFYTA